MPNYTWTCGACGSRNEPQIEICSHCNCPAHSSLKQREAHSAAIGEGRVIPVRGSRQEFVSLELYLQVVEIRRTAIACFVSGVLALMVLMYLDQHYWDLSSTKLGVKLMVVSGVALIFGPIAIYWSKLRCPRCSQSWLSEGHSHSSHGVFIIWAFASSFSCAHCGLSLSARPAKYVTPDSRTD